jgi:hypothetical protein
MARDLHCVWTAVVWNRVVGTNEIVRADCQSEVSPVQTRAFEYGEANVGEAEIRLRKYSSGCFEKPTGN